MQHITHGRSRVHGVLYSLYLKGDDGEAIVNNSYALLEKFYVCFLWCAYSAIKRGWLILLRLTLQAEIVVYRYYLLFLLKYSRL